jgi:two-component system chemotaxis response regulator CheB
MRQVLGDLLSSQPDIEVAGYARDGLEAVRLVQSLSPDVLVLDLDMRRLSGLDAVSAILTVAPTPIVVATSHPKQSAQAALEALDRGAIDVVCKPRSGGFLALSEARDELCSKVRAAKGAQLGLRLKRGVPAAMPGRRSDHVILAVGSTGAVGALTCLFQTLPRDLHVPILVMPHLPPGFAEALARRLSAAGGVPMREAFDADRLVTGQALIVPGGRRMLVGPHCDLEITTSPAEDPVDALLRSAAEAFGSRCILALLTGMGQDGAAGALAIRQAGGRVLAESRFTCMVSDLPQAASRIGAVDSVHPIQEIGHAMVALLGKRASRAA